MTECELCSKNHPNEIWRNPRFYILDAGTDEFPAFLRVVCARHVTEMSELSQEERSELIRILLKIEEIFIAKLGTDKVNWAQFGNVVSHVHWHIVGRWKDDAFFPDSPWGSSKRAVPEELVKKRRAAMADVVKTLVAELDAQ